MRRISLKKILIAIILLLVLISLSIFLISLTVKGVSKVTNRQSTKIGYICSANSSLKLYDLNYNEVSDIIRGTKVKIKGEVKDSNLEYYKINYNNKDYLVLKENVTLDNLQIVKEKEKYVKTPLTVYKDSKSSKILGYLKKGSKVSILGYDYLNADGSVNKYKISYDDSEGYIYSKYLTDTLDEANIYYLQDKFLNVGNTLGGGTASELDYYPVIKGNFSDNIMPDEVRSLYLNVSAIRNVDNYITFAKENNINAFVVDIKDNTSPGYESSVMQEYSITNYEHAVSTKDEYKSYIKKLKDNGFYVIGRITVFKDSYFVEDHPEVAITSSSNGQPFNHNGSYWPSGFQRLVWEFNVELAKEAVTEMGFNEIQFDYVRFPDRTLALENNGTINMNNVYGETKAQALQAFLMYAVDELHALNVYVSADVFGECAHNYVAGYGQYWPAISNIVDVISGMPYPDHFNAHEYGIEEVVWTVPYKLLNVWGSYVASKQEMIETPAKVRTWIQTYNTVKTPYVTYDANKLSEQIEALYANGLDDGYMTWNSASNLTKYQEVKNAFKKEYKNE